MKIRTRLISAHTFESIITGVIAGLPVVALQEPLGRWMLPLVELLARTGEIGIGITIILLTTFIAVLSPTSFHGMIKSLWYLPMHWGMLSKVIIGMSVWIGYEAFLGHPFEAYEYLVFAWAAFGIGVGYVVARIMVRPKHRRKKDDLTEIKKTGLSEWFADDMPAMTIEENLLEEHRLLAKRIIDRILAKGAEKEGVLPSLALIGDYGAGKTSICNFVEDLYNKKQIEGLQLPKILFCRFEGWQFLAEDAAVMGLLRIATERISQAADVAELWRVPERYVDAISESGGLWGRLIGLLCGGNDAPERVASSIGDTLIRLHRRLVLFVDDLDRMEVDAPLCQRAITKALNQLQSVPNVQYVISVGPMSIKSERGEDIRPRMDLLKLTRYQELVPEIDPDVVISKIKELRDEVLKDKECYFPWAEIKQKDDDPLDFSAALAPSLSFFGFSYKIAGLVKTPRALKAVLRETHASWEGGLKGEINWYDLVLANALKTAEPRVFEWVARNRKTFEGVAENINRNDQEKSKKYADHLKKMLEECVGSEESGEFEVVRRTLEYLFPKFGANLSPALSVSFWGQSPGEWEQHLSCYSRSKTVFGISYLVRFFSGKVTEPDLPDQPTLQYIKKINMKGFDAREFEELYLSSLEKLTGVVNKLVQFAEIVSTENRYKICETLLEWISEPEHAKVWPEPDRYVYDMMHDVLEILKNNTQYRMREEIENEEKQENISKEWFEKTLDRLTDKSPLTAIVFTQFVEKEYLSEGTNLSQRLSQKLYEEFIAGERSFGTAFSSSKHSLRAFIGAIHKRGDYKDFNKRFTEKLIAEADGEGSHILKAMVLLCLVEFTYPARSGPILIEEYKFSVNKDENEAKFDMEIVVGALQRWKDISLPDPVASKAMEHLLKAYSQQ